MSDSSFYLDHFRLNRIPYRQQPDPEVFFAEAGRGEILQNLCVDIIGGKPFIRLTGGEGTGKTLLQLLLARKLGIKKFEVVSLDHPVGSFDDLLRTISRELAERAGAAGGEPGGHDGYLAELLELLRARSGAGQRVVLLVDEAEQLFLATLERLVRLLVDIGGEKLLQVVLVGRPELERNLQQLSGYCTDADVHAGYSLRAMDLDETRRYLCFRLVQAGCPEEKAGQVFGDATIAALYDQARGNLSLTNLLAEQGLIAAYEAGMFQVGPELISPRQARQPRHVPVLPLLRSWVRNSPLPVIGAALLVLVLLLLVFRPGNEQADSPANGPAVAEAENQEGGETPAPVTMPAPPPDAKGEGGSVPEKPVDGVGRLVSLAKIMAAEEVVSPVPVPEPLPERAPTLAAEESLPAEPAPESAPEPAPEPESAEPESAEPEPAEPAPPAPVAEVPPPQSLPAADKVVVLQAVARKRKVAETGGVEEHPATAAAKDPEQVFAERLRASSGWRSRSGYTIQLMALASEDAEENFRRLLAQKRYAAVQDQLYLMRKASPPTLFVYYGSFASMGEARLGRDRLPDFLLKNHPYPLSIDQAAKKAQP